MIFCFWFVCKGGWGGMAARKCHVSKEDSDDGRRFDDCSLNPPPPPPPQGSNHSWAAVSGRNTKYQEFQRMKLFTTGLLPNVRLVSVCSFKYPLQPISRTLNNTKMEEMTDPLVERVKPPLSVAAYKWQADVWNPAAIVSPKNREAADVQRKKSSTGANEATQRATGSAAGHLSGYCIKKMQMADNKIKTYREQHTVTGNESYSAASSQPN